MIIKGMIIGVVVSAPMGPVGILCVQRTLNKDRWCGFVTGLGAALSDIIYALMTGFGMSFIMDTIESPTVAFWIKVVGSVLLFLFGLFTFKSNPIERVKPVSHNKGTLFHNFISGFLVTISNPLIIFLFIAMYGQMTFILPDSPLLQIIGYLFVIVGAVGWWFLLTWLIDKVRNKFNVRGIWLINRIIGSVVMLVSVLILLHTVRDYFKFVI
ncbi:MAG: LysE family transporter [Bacteroidaceae bacterium]|jgi:threonine/homoserine/homoserine lactone efflux protein|nr:LysE family transporter [Bacteroidaceae bacterium]